MVVAAGSNSDGECNTQNWRNIIALSASCNHTVALNSNGTVVAVGNNDFGQCNVQKWEGIIAVSAGDGFTVGLKSDKTVVAVGDNKCGQCNVCDWQEIIALSTEGAFGFRNGQMYLSNYTVGLKSDGTVVVVGDNTHGKFNIQNWQNIIAISAGDNHIVGLKNDGTVVAIGDNSSNQCNTQDWQNIALVPKEHYSQMIQDIEKRDNEIKKVWNEYKNRKQIKNKRCPLCNEKIKGLFNSKIHCNTCHTIIQKINGVHGFSEELLKGNILEICKHRFGENWNGTL